MKVHLVPTVLHSLPPHFIDGGPAYSKGVCYVSPAKEGAPVPGGLGGMLTQDLYSWVKARHILPALHFCPQRSERGDPMEVTND